MLGGLVPSITRTAALVGEISDATREQSAGATQLGGAMDRLRDVVQQNAGAAEEMASTAEELSAHAEQLNGTVAWFRVASPGQAVLPDAGGDLGALARPPARPQLRA
jgi:methyl-accepting chemotaxis protein